MSEEPRDDGSHMNIIDRGIERIREGGWRRLGQRGTKTPTSNCMLTSLHGETGEILKAYQALMDVLGGDGVDAVARFNDHPATSYEDMMLAMKQASAIYDADLGR